MILTGPGSGVRIAGMAIRYGVLGPLVVGDGERQRTVPSAKQRVLLAALLLRADRVVPAGELCEALWPGQPARRAQTSLHTLVNRARARLAERGAADIVFRTSGYLIETGDGELDLRLFERAHAAGRAAAREGDWAGAARLLRDALGLWRGDFLADVPATRLLEAHGPYRAEQRLQALELRIDADLRLGDSDRPVTELRRLLGEFPLRERFHAQLLLALHRSGRRADALAAFLDARRVLVAQLGMEPGRELRELHRRILADDPTLTDLPGAERRPVAASAGGRPVPRQLPSFSPHFTGRAEVMEKLTALARRPGGAVAVGVIDGMAGVGKTTVAVRWAHRMADRFPDGQLFADLRGFGPSGEPLQPADVARQFLEALGIPQARIPFDPASRLGLYRSVLSDRRVLLVLDNARDAGHVRPLLPGSGTCLVLVTSRNRLAGLTAIEGAVPVHLDPFDGTEARDLLDRHLGLATTSADPEAAGRIVELCAALPLALSIAATRASVAPGLPLPVLAAELAGMGGRLDAFEVGDDTAADLRGVFSWSTAGLDPGAARMFRLLAVHPGPDVSGAAAAGLAGATPAAASAALDVLTRANLLTRTAPDRFALHDLLRAHAAEEALGRQEDRDAALRRLCDHYLRTSHAAALRLLPDREPLPLPPPAAGSAPRDFDDAVAATAWFKAEHHVLAEVVRLAARHRLHVHAGLIAWNLDLYFGRFGCWEEWIGTQEVALSSAREAGDLAAQARALRSLGAVKSQCGLDGEADRHLLAALDLCRRTGDLTSQAYVHVKFAFLADQRGRPAVALGHAQEALRLYRGAGHRRGIASALGMLARYHTDTGSHERALEHCRQALDRFAELGGAAGASAAWAWESAGYAHQRLGRYGEATVCYGRAADLFRAAEDHRRQALMLEHLADTHRAAGDPQAADTAWERARRILEGFGPPGGPPAAGAEPGPALIPAEAQAQA